MGYLLAYYIISRIFFENNLCLFMAKKIAYGICPINDVGHTILTTPTHSKVVVKCVN